MKKISVIFALLLALLTVLVGCNQTPTEITVPTTAPVANSLSVGYARVDITPRESVPMGGYGDGRMSTSTQDPLYATCIAFTDAKDNTVLFIPLDLTRSYSEVIPKVRSYISEKTGIPLDNIITTASHTHSSPDLAKTDDLGIQNYNEALPDLILRAANEALADRKPAEMYTSYIRADGMNRTRHYLLKDGSYAGNGFSFTAGDILGHIGVTDSLMQLVKFTREGGKDVLLVNWQGHYKDPKDTYFTADYFGVMRSILEKDMDCLFAYVAGAGGDTISNSKIPELKPSADCAEHGQKLSDIAKEAAKNFEKAEIGEIQVIKSNYGAPVKSAPNSKMDVPLEAFSLGDVAFACAPYEMSGINGITIKEGSDFKVTFVATQSNMHLFYVPAEFCFDYESYEAGVSRLARGAGELLAEEFVRMLDTLYANTGLTPAQKDESYYYKAPEPTSDGVLYINMAAGDLTAYTEGTSGAFVIQLVGPEGLTNHVVQTKELTEKILAQQTVRLVFNSSGMVVDMESSENIGITSHEDPATVQTRSGSAVTLVLADGNQTQATLSDDLLTFDMRDGTIGTELSLQTGDTITYLSDKDGVILLAFVTQRTPILSLCDHCKEEVEWNEWHNAASLPSISNGHYKLMVDVTLSGEYAVSGGNQLVLDLNGHTVTGAQNKRVIRISGSSTKFALMDTSTEASGKIIGKGTIVEAGMCVLVSTGTFELYSGTVDGSQTNNTANGCAIQCSTSGGIIHMFGGTIIGGTTTSSASEGGKGGSVSIAGIMVMDGGLITGGQARAYYDGDTYVRGGQGGNVYVASTGKFTMNGGTITGGKAEVEDDNLNIGTVGVATGTFIKNGGTIG